MKLNAIQTKILILKAHTNQCQIAKKMGVSKQSVNYWVNAKYPISLDRICQLAELLSAKVDDFLVDDEQPGA
jgi:transcriptional regulator with XRE-family HTH domain